MAVKPPSGQIPPAQIPAQPTQANQAKTAQPVDVPKGVVNPEAIAKALKDFKKLKKESKKPFMRGAASLFTGAIEFPEDLLDPENSLNDINYMRLFFAMNGNHEIAALLGSEEQREEVLQALEEESSNA